MDYRAALAYIDEHVNLERMLGRGRPEAPTLDRMRRLVDVMGDPQLAYPVIHITGTNGKGSTAQIITRLLVAQGLTVGTYTSPHLERINERISRDAEAITDEDFAEQVGAIADLEVVAGVRPSYFEILTAAAYRWFADVAVDVAVVEVGLLGRWDATNVADGRVCVVTNVGLDHTEMAGPTRADVAWEKAGIVKADSTLVLGETDPDLGAIFRAENPAAVWEREMDFGVSDNQLALGGRQLELRTPLSAYGDLFLPLYGRHQGDNAAAALCAAESFFDAPLHPDVVTEAFAAVRMPGRFEVLGHQPLVVVDGAHNVPGVEVCAEVLADDFDPAGDKIFVVGLLRGHDITDMLGNLRIDEAAAIVCCTPPTPRAYPASELAAVARSLGCDQVLTVPDVAQACDRALALAGADDAVVVTGSLYLVGAARPHLRKVLA
jgi:dihydrofolate synthase/folylpolyglutamate synthase